MPIIESIKKGFKATHESITLLIGLFVFNLVVNLINIPLQGRIPRPAPGQPLASGEFQWLLLGFLFNAAVILIGIFIQGGLLHYLHDVVKGIEVEVERFWEGGTKYFLRLLGLGALVIAYLLAILVVAGIVTMILTAPFGQQGAARMVITNLVGLLFAALAFVSLLFLAFTPYVIVLQDAPIRGAIRDSINFVRDRLFQAIGMLLLLIAIGVGIGMAVGIVLGGIGAILGRGGVAFQIASALAFAALNAYVIILGTAGLMAFFLAQAPAAPAPEGPVGQA